MKSNTFSKRLPLLLIAVLILTVCFSIGSMTLIDGTAFAASELEVGSSETITIAHISDTHYFPLEYCYAYTTDEEGNNIDYIDKTSELYLLSDFYDSTTGDTKLITESGAILNAIIQNIISLAEEKVSALEEALGTENEDAAREALDAVPDYVLLTGDLTKNSERVALIDVANAFRYMQNKMRLISYTDEGTKTPFENFQVFAFPGNHDLYNGSASLYDNIRDNGILDGSSYLADTADTRLFAMIFAGLGFPDIDEGILNNVLRAQVKFGSSTYLNTGLTDLNYWYGSLTGEYVYSTTADNLKISYYCDALQNIANAEIGDFETEEEYYAYLLSQYSSISSKNNILSYAIEIMSGKVGEVDTASTGYSIIMCDSSDRVVTTSLVPIVANSEQILSSKNLYTFNEVTNTYELLAEDQTVIKSAITAGNVVYYNTGMDHITGGKITEEFLDWLKNDVIDGEGSTFSTNNSGFDGTDETIVFACHHNILPHFDKEDDLLKDFTIYNWEYVTKYLLQIGVRYTLSGHMHSSDIASYVDAEGNVLYDFETGSTVSYSAPSRHIEINRDYYYDGTDYVVAEKLDTNITELQTLAEVQTSNIALTSAVWHDTDVSSLTTDAEKFAARYAENPDFFLYSYLYHDLSTMTYNNYIDEELYSQLLSRMLGHFLSMDMIDELRGSLGTFFNGTFRNMLGGMFGDYADVTYKLVDSMIDQLLNGMTYTYNGTEYIGTDENPGLLLMVNAVVDDFVDADYGLDGHKISFRNLVVKILLNHTTGNEFTNLNQVLNPEEPASGSDQAVFDRYYFAYALRDLILNCEDGTMVESLFNSLLNPILLDDTSLLKTLLAYKFDFSDLNLSESEIASANELFSTAVELLNSLMEEGSPLLTDDMVSLDNFCLGNILETAQGFLSSMLANTFGIYMGDMGVIEFAEDFISKYMVESFYTGTGGIVKDIIVAFGVDTVQDVEDQSDFSIPYFLQYAKNYVKDASYAVVHTSNLPEDDIYYTYVQGQTVSELFNPATTENGRLPSKITSNFDTVDSTSAYTFSYYTDEDIFTKFEILDENDNLVATVETSPEGTITYNTTFTEPGKIGWETRTNSATASGITATLLTTTMPAYVPLIDLGILCLTHTEITYEVNDVEYYYSAGMRDGNLDNSALHISNYVVYKNHHTIKITGLATGTTYKYRVYGTYKDEEFALLSDSGLDYFTMTTAPASSQDTFSFLAIADLQASILADYQASSAVFDKIASTEEINNYDFILNAGDMTDNGKNYYQWGWALDTMSEYFANTSMFITSGNHEDGSNALNNYFNYSLEENVNDEQLTEDGLYYSLDYGTLHVIVLNTNDADKNGLGTAQYDWLQADLEANTSKWTIVLMHKGLYTAGSHSRDIEVVAMRSQLTKLFAENGVDIVLAGHDHTYTTTCVVDKNGNIVDSTVDKNGYIINADGGTIYMTIGTMGEKYYTYGNNENVNPKFDTANSLTNTLDAPTFAYFSFEGDQLVISGYQYAGATSDLSKITDIKITKTLGEVGT
ncbi:MAG: metallophosphoesterase, partial [Clostridia bacterium]|nr:metallophosphoesterase [Clostridia bacterium]